MISSSFYVILDGIGFIVFPYDVGSDVKDAGLIRHLINFSVMDFLFRIFPKFEDVNLLSLSLNHLGLLVCPLVSFSF